MFSHFLGVDTKKKIFLRRRNPTNKRKAGNLEDPKAILHTPMPPKEVQHQRISWAEGPLRTMLIFENPHNVEGSAIIAEIYQLLVITNRRSKYLLTKVNTVRLY